jgi:hypothetical protein
VTYTGRLANGVKRLEQLGYPRVGGIGTILGDVVPDAIQVPVGTSLRM